MNVDAAEEASHDRLDSVVAAALDRKAEDLRVLQLEGICDFTDLFVICGAGSTRQVGAIADAVVRRVQEETGEKPLHVEGAGGGLWVLIDYGDLIVHVFERERRRLYRLEEIWSDAIDLTDEVVADEADAVRRALPEG